MNPHAPAFKPEYTDQHCLYLTFSNGFPLTESQVYTFFNRSYAPYVEEVIVYRTRGGRGPPFFRKVVFKTCRIPDHVMGNNEKVVFNVCGRPLYCKRYVSQKKKTKATVSNTSPDGGDE